MSKFISKIVRVAVTNNFNCTKEEFDQLDSFSERFPDTPFFINSNIKTPELININNHCYPVVITLNPDILVDPRLVNRLYDIASERISFVRIKYIPEHQDIVDLILEISMTHNVVITAQRFKSVSYASKFIKDVYKHYKQYAKGSWLRLYGQSWKDLLALEGSNGRTYICDRDGLGCADCGLCDRLTFDTGFELFSLNLSTSGICPHNCPDCYAKNLQSKLTKWGYQPINFNKIVRNKKQSGDLAHIRHSKKGII